MENALPFYHAVIGDVDIKTKIVALGCQTEGVTIHCSRHGRHLPWNPETELQAREVLSWVLERFKDKDYKLIPVPAPQGLGLKIYPTQGCYARGEEAPGEKAQAPSAQTVEIFREIQKVIDDNNSGGKVFMRHRAGRNSDEGGLSDHALRREITRIIRSGGHVETKVRDIVRLIGAA